MEQASSAHKIRRTSMVDQVYDILKQEILDGTLANGQRLPSESELASQFGVNRLTVRMALQRLSALGLAETRVGDGTYVREVSLQPLLDEMETFYTDGEHLEDVTALRNLLESECARLAILIGTEEEKQELRQRLAAYDEASNRYQVDYDNDELLSAVTSADFAFHRQIIRMGHNKLYADIYHVVEHLIRSNIRELIYQRTVTMAQRHLLYSEVDLSQHTILCDAICRGDLAAAQNACKLIIHVLPIPGVDE